MEQIRLENEQIEVTVNIHGAELRSLKSKADGQEYLWNADTKYWGRTSPVLFPFVGGVKNKVYRHEGKEYPMNQHGFARDMDFTLISRSTDEAWLALEDTDETWEKVICSSSFSRYPVCDGSPDRVVGVLNAKVYLREKDKSRDNIMCSALEPAYFVPETVKADVLFRNMKQTHNTFAVVLDEYGGLTGVVTMQDLIEELVGALQEKPSISETAEPQIKQIDCNTWEISGNAELDEIERAIGVSFDTEYINTFTGYIFDRLKGIPDDGKTNIELKLDNISVTIKEIKDHQVVLAEIKRIDHSTEKETQK